MFGIFYAIANAVAYLTSGIKMGVEDSISKRNAIDKERLKEIKTNTYMDHRGTTRDITTNKIVMISKDYLGNGDTYIYDNKLNPIRNLSQEKRDLEYEKAKINHKQTETVALYMSEKEAVRHEGFKSFLSDGFVRGDRYKDLDNGRIYVIREIKSNYLYGDMVSNGRSGYYGWNFYIDIETKKIVREEDSHYLIRKRNIMYGYPHIDDERMEAVIFALNNHLGKSKWKDKNNSCMLVTKYEDGSVGFSWEED